MSRNPDWDKLRPSHVQRDASRERRARYGTDKPIVEERARDERSRNYFGKEARKERRLKEILEAADRIEELECLNAGFEEWRALAIPLRDELRGRSDPSPAVNELMGEIADEIDQLLEGFPLKT